MRDTELLERSAVHRQLFDSVQKYEREHDEAPERAYLAEALFGVADPDEAQKEVLVGAIEDLVRDNLLETRGVRVAVVPEDPSGELPSTVAGWVRHLKADSNETTGIPRTLVETRAGEEAVQEAVERGEVYAVGERLKVP